ncbi:ABC transporter permease [Dyella flagellata]
MEIAVSSLWRNRLLSSLVIAVMALGIGGSMTMLSVVHVLSGDPLPGRSKDLFTPYLNPLPLSYRNDRRMNPSDNLTWPDAWALLSSRRADLQAAMAGAHLLVTPGSSAQPFYAEGRFVTADFFEMFALPFFAGHSWGRAEDDAHARVVVLSQRLAMRLFNGPAIGHSIRLGGVAFDIVGVADHFDPQPKFYGDIASHPFGEQDDFFLPLTTAIDRKLEATSSFASWGSKGAGNEMESPGVTWLQFWIRLDSPQKASSYKAYLDHYWARQHTDGRFERAPDAKLYGLNEWLARKKVIPRDLTLQMALAFAFLLVCMANMTGLLFAKFSRKSGEVAVRRALGAKRADIVWQFSAEAVVIGLVGGAIGLALAQLGLWTIRRQPDEYAHLVTMDGWMLLATFVLGIVASALAALVPAVRASMVEPALQVKVAE